MIPRPLRIVLFILGCAVVLWLSLAPGETLPTVNLWDKAKHAVAYFVLMLAGAYAFPERLWRGSAILFGIGIGIEGLQSVMDLGRQGEVLDAVANSVGIIAGLLLALAIREAIKVKSRVAGE